MPSRPIPNFCILSGAAVPFSLSTPDVFPGGKRERLNVTCGRHSRKMSYDRESIHHDRDASATSVKKDRRRTIDCGLSRPSLTPRDYPTEQAARILPQRIITPTSATGLQSIWFQSKSDRPDVGVSLTDIVDIGVERVMIAPEERVFQGFHLGYDEIQFSILWPGYGNISWIASIPINLREESGYQCGPITRRLLASAVAQHFQAFMINHSYLRFPHPDPCWKIRNNQQDGIRFENLRLTRLFSYKDEAGKLGSWQAEILVVEDPPIIY